MVWRRAAVRDNRPAVPLDEDGVGVETVGSITMVASSGPGVETGLPQLRQNRLASGTCDRHFSQVNIGNAPDL